MLIRVMRGEIDHETKWISRYRFPPFTWDCSTFKKIKCMRFIYENDGKKFGNSNMKKLLPDFKKEK